MDNVQSWPNVRLDEIATFRNGVNFNKDSFGTGIKVLGVSDFQDYTKPRYEELKQINPAGIVTERSILRDGDIVFVRSNGNPLLIGRSVLIQSPPEQITHSAFTIRLRFDKSDVVPQFYAYLFRTQLVRQALTAQGGGTNISNLNQDILGAMEVPVPPLSAQYKLSEMLSAYDQLIENNQRRIRILEEMARSLYREWFVHFRFPGHENHPCVSSSFGEIPQGWEVISFTKIADVFSGGTPKTDIAEYWNGQIPFFTPRDAPANFYVSDTDKHVTELGISKCASQLYAPDTVFITARGTVGKVAMPSVSMAMNQSCYALRGKQGISQRFLFLMTLQQVEYLKTNTGGATFSTIVVDTFARMQVIKPPQVLISRFTDLVDGIFNQIRTLHQQMVNLRLTRDLLLPRLLSGQIKLEAN